MADHAVENNEIFVYTGEQAPLHITHARIDESVEVIEDEAFYNCRDLVHVETHNRIRRIEEWAFYGCKNLPRIDIKSVVEICEGAFCRCRKLQFIEFGDKLESIGSGAFRWCSIEQLKLPSVVNVGGDAFAYCDRLIDVEFSEQLESIAASAFYDCERLHRIAIPLKRNLLEDGTVFNGCEQLTRVDLVGGVHQTISSLHMEIWRAEMNTEINRINQLLSNAFSTEKTRAIRQWMDSVNDKLDYYKTEHFSYVKEAATLLELALWKAKLAEREDSCEERVTKKAKINADDARKECRVTCGADLVIKNVLPFLQLLE